MKEDTSYTKMMLLSLISIIIFLLQYTLGLVGNFLLMIATHLVLSVSLPKWMKDKRLPIKNKIILCFISFLLISSFFYHNYVFIDVWSSLLVFWGISILFDITGYVFNRIKNRN